MSADVRPPLPSGVLREALIDTAAMASNTRRMAEITGTPVMSVVKADGYGHGAVRSARAAVAGGAVMLGVTSVDEALELRAAGIPAPVLSWQHAPGAHFDDAVAADITLGLSTFEQLDAAITAGSTMRPASVHVKLETGLSRNGFAPADWEEMFRRAVTAEADGRIRVTGIFSHLSNASDDDDRAALATFLGGVERAHTAGLRPAMRHLAATCGALAVPEARLDAVRIGIGTYGLSPDPARFEAAALGLRPAMTLRASVANVRDVPAGTGTSYGYTYRTDRDTTLALVPVGYADGIPRQASNRASVLIRETLHPVAGRIAMDQFIVDVGDTDVQVGDEVVVFGDAARGEPTAEDWAAAADTINYEIVTRIGSRVRRVETGA